MFVIFSVLTLIFHKLLTNFKISELCNFFFFCHSIIFIKSLAIFKNLFSRPLSYYNMAFLRNLNFFQKILTWISLKGKSHSKRKKIKSISFLLLPSLGQQSLGDLMVHVPTIALRQENHPGVAALGDLSQGLQIPNLHGRLVV